MDDHKIGTYNFVAEPFHVDFTGKLTMGVLGNHLLNALFLDYPSRFLCQLFSFKFLLRKYKKYILNLIRGNKN